VRLLRWIRDLFRYPKCATCGERHGTQLGHLTRCFVVWSRTHAATPTTPTEDGNA
jgi:hypothetical protein